MLIKQCLNSLNLLLGYIDWGNNRQRASKLCKHLSDDLKDKLMTRSDNYALMRESAEQTIIESSVKLDTENQGVQTLGNRPCSALN